MNSANLSRTVLVFGGAFNPPTIAHEAIITACLALPQYDELWLMPSGQRADKHISVSGRRRLEMLRILRAQVFHDDPRLKVNDFELGLPEPNRTYLTLQALRAAYPTTQFWFVFGSDSYIDMPHWRHGTQLQQELPMVIVPRARILPTFSRPDIILLDMPESHPGASSTAARKRIAAHQPASDLVRQPILDYIAQNRLYEPTA